MKSIIQDTKECYFTHRTDNLHEHHIFQGKNRNMSEKYGLKIWITTELHTTGNNSMHHSGNTDVTNKLKQMAQKKAMEYYSWSTEDFIRIFGKNYL